MLTKSSKIIGAPALLVGLYAAMSSLAQAGPPTVTGATPLQQTVFNAVLNMCANVLDGHSFTGPTQDLHDQCHAIAVSALSSGAGSPALSNALGALQQVSGNQISTQGALATRVSAGQFGNITGRLNALRFGSDFAAAHGLTDLQQSPFPDDSSVASTGQQGYYFDRSMLSASRQSDEFSPGGFLPTADFQTSGGLLNTLYSDTSRSPSYGGTSAVPNPWGAFVQGSYNSGHHDLTSNEDPFHFHASSVTAGIDYNFGNAVLGASIGHDDYDASFNATGAAVTSGSAQVKGTSGSLYGAWYDDKWTFNGIATYGHLTTHLSRTLNYQVSYSTAANSAIDDQTSFITDNCPGGTCTVGENGVLKGDPSGKVFAVGATAGYQYSAYSWDMLPSLSANYRRIKIDSFSESDPTSATDGLALAFGDQTVESLRSILAIDLARPISVPFGVVSPIVRAEWDHEFKTGLRTIAAHYALDPSLAQGGCASCFNLPTDSPAANYGVAGAGVSMTLPHRIQAFVLDEVLFGYSKYHSNSVTLGLRGQF